jgi:hypothetical protein
VPNRAREEGAFAPGARVFLSWGAGATLALEG